MDARDDQNKIEVGRIKKLTEQKIKIRYNLGRLKTLHKLIKIRFNF